METEKTEDSTCQIDENQLDPDELLSIEKGLKAPRWRDRANAARVAASALVKDGCVRNLRSKEGLTAGRSHVADAYDKLLRQLLHGLALKDSQWQVRLAAVETAATVLEASQSVLPPDMFAEYVWVVLASCLDVQPEVQLAASKCISQGLLSSSFQERHVIVAQLLDRFIEAASTANTSPWKNSKLPTKSEVTGLDNLPDGEWLLTAMTAAIHLLLLPLRKSDEMTIMEHDRIPLLVVIVALAFEDANKRQSRMIARGLSKLLRCLGAPYYRQSLLAMFNPRTPVYISGSGLATTYQNAGIINEDTSNLLKTVNIVTLLKALSLAFEPSHVVKFLTNVIISDDGSALPPSKASGLSQEELIALQQILEMLHIPDDLTKTFKDQDKDSKTFEFTESAISLLNISTSIIKNRNWDTQDQPLAKKLVEDIVLCCATFAGGDGEYGGAATWTSKQLRELSLTLLTSLPDTVHPMGAPKVATNGLKDARSARILRLISEEIPSLLPRIKQVIRDSSGSSGSEVHTISPHGSVGSSIIAAYQMQWILTQLEHPNLGPHCQLVMPCVLTALDHFSPEVKRQAMLACIHVAHNMNPTELRWYKDVILDTVARNLVGCGDLWPVAVKMAVTTVTQMEGKNSRGSWCGRIFSEMIGELERQRDDQGRRILWLQEISPHMETLGLVLVAHFKRLLPLLYYWLHAPDDATCLLTLTKLQIVITCTWPRIPAHAKRMWKEMILTYQQSSNRKSRPDIQEAVRGVCKLLQLCAGPTFEAVWQHDEEDKSINTLVSFLKQMKIESTLQV